jgi:sulfite exporter TauE/SafE
MGNIWLAFVTGLTTGGISCITVQGGLLASSTKNKGEVGIFLASKLVIYTLLGFLLGFLGSILIISPRVQAIMQIIVGIYLLGTAARLANLHPIFRYFAIQPPKSLFKLARAGSKTESFFAPVIAGLATVLIPCGVTQAVMLIAIATKNPLSGATIMFAFVLGTSPVFFALGLTAVEMLKRKTFAVIAAVIIAIFGLISLKAGVTLAGWSLPIKSTAVAVQKQVVTITVRNNGYQADATTLKVNTPVKIKLVTNNTFSCARSFTIPAMNISKILPTTGTEEISFTPTRTGRLNYTCSMGMYSGSFNVIQ